MANPDSKSKPRASTSKSVPLKERVQNALVSGTAGGYIGGLLVGGKTRVRVPTAALRGALGMKRRKTVSVHGARLGAGLGAAAGFLHRKRSKSAQEIAERGTGLVAATTAFSAFIEDMTFDALPKDVQAEVSRFVDAKKGTPVVHYGMTVTELVMKADATNLTAARKALGTLRASRARDDVMGKVKAGSKYVLIMNDRIVDGHHFLAKAERGAVTSSLNVLDLTPARLSTGKVTEFAGKPEEKKNPRSRILDAGALGLAGSITGGVAGAGAGHVAGGGSVKDAPAALKRAFGKAKKWLGAAGQFGPNAKESLTPAQKEGQRIKEALDEAAGEKWKRAEHPSRDAFQSGRLTRGELQERAKLQKQFRQTKARRKGALIGALALGGVGAVYAARKRPLAVKSHSQEDKGKQVGGRIGALTGAGIGSVAGGVLAHNPLLGAVVGTTAGAHLGRRVGSAVGSRMKASDREISARESAAKKKQLKLSALGKFTQFAEEPRRNRTRDLRDKIGLAKDVAGLGVTVGAGVGAHKLYKGGKQVLRRVGPQIGAAAKAWHKAALKTGKTLDTVKDAVAPAAGVNRGVASVGRKIVQGARKVGAFLHMAHDPRLVQNFTGGNGGNGGRTLKPLFSPLSPVPFRFAEPRDRLSKARDAALLAAGAAGTGAVIYGATKMKEAGKVADNLRNTTAIGADVGRVYRKGRRVVTESVDAFKGGMKDAMSKPAPKWKKGVVKMGKKLRLLEAKGARTLLSASFKPLRAGVPALLSNEFGVGGLVGSGIGTLIGSQIGERFKYKTRNALKKKLIPKLGQKWGRRVARMGQFVPENAGALVGGVVGSIAGGGIRNRGTEMSSRFSVRGSQLVQFGGKEQLKEIDSGAFPDPLDVFIGRKKGYLADTVKAYHREKNYVKDVQSGKKQGTPQAVAASQAEMKRLRGDSVEASHGQVYRSLLKKGDTVRRVSERGGGLIRDAVKHAKGEEREKDAWGRTKKREWEKPWFQRTKNQVAAAAALGGGAMLLKKNPRLRARVDRGVRQAQRKVNSVVPDFFTGVKPLRQPGQKTAASVQAKRQSVAQAKAAKTQASMAANAQKIAKAAAAVKPVKPKKRAGVPALPSKRGSGTPPLKGLARINGRLIEFSDDPLDVGWDLRDARGRSARVFAPGSNARDRRPKKWHEKIDNERKLWGAAALTGTLTGAAATRKLLKGGLSKQIVTATSQAEKRAARWKTVAKNQHARLKTKPKSNVISASFKPSAAA